MPAEFPSAVTGPLNTMRTAARTATSFASNVVSLLTALVGANNPFGSAATREAGTAAGNVPVLNAAGRIEPSLLPSATDSVRGAVVLARNLRDERAGVVATAAQVSAAAATTQGLDATNFTLTQLSSGVVFTAPAVGLIVVGAAGGGGHRPDGSRASFLRDGGAGGNAAASYLYYGPQVASDSATTRIEVRGGYGGAVRGLMREGNTGVNFLSPPAATGRPDLAMVMRGKGGLGGDGGAYNGGTDSLEVGGLAGDDG